MLAPKPTVQIIAADGQALRCQNLSEAANFLNAKIDLQHPLQETPKIDVYIKLGNGCELRGEFTDYIEALKLVYFAAC
jgi:hypothetical protein